MFIRKLFSVCSNVIQIFIVITFILCLTAGYGVLAAPTASVEQGDSERTMQSVAPTPHELGREIYNYRCYFCHGYAGDAKTLASSYLKPKPRNFRAPEAKSLSRGEMIEAVTEGRQGTAMQPFSKILIPDEVALVIDFIRKEFIELDRHNSRYHTAENGWVDHQRYHAAFAFATGEIPLDKSPAKLTQEQRDGRRFFMQTCISCHDRAKVIEEGEIWDRQAVSYPRLGFKAGDFMLPPDSISGASPYSQHDVPVNIPNLTVVQTEGERLFQNNCAFCHGADGTGKNWIGSFLDVHPRDLTSKEFMGSMTQERLHGIIVDGIIGTSMPAWRHVLTAQQINAIIAYIDRAFHKLVTSPE